MNKLNHALILTCCVLSFWQAPVLAASTVTQPVSATVPAATATVKTPVVKKTPQLTRSQFATAYDNARLISLAAGACAGT